MTITFREDGVNDLIRHWRRRKAKAQKDGNNINEHTASCYVDAYQTIRVNHGLGLLPAEVENVK